MIAAPAIIAAALDVLLKFGRYGLSGSGDSAGSFVVNTFVPQAKQSILLPKFVDLTFECPFRFDAAATIIAPESLKWEFAGVRLSISFSKASLKSSRLLPSGSALASPLPAGS